MGLTVMKALEEEKDRLRSAHDQLRAQGERWESARTALK